MKTIAQIQETITSQLHGTSIGNLPDFKLLCSDAAENMLLRIDPQETIRSAPLANPVYDRVYDYTLPTDFKAPLNFKEQIKKGNTGLMRTMSREFANSLVNNQFSIVWENGLQFMRFSKLISRPLTVDACDEITSNGTWAVGGDGSALEIDILDYLAGNGSLKITASNSGAINDVKIRIGANSSNYYEGTITTGFLKAFVEGWNQVSVQIKDMTLTGTVDLSTIAYVKVNVHYNGSRNAYIEKTLTEPLDLSGNYEGKGALFFNVKFDSLTAPTTIHFDSITASLGAIYELPYYSNALFKRATTGEWITKPISNDDTVNLSPNTYKIFEAELFRRIAQQVQGAFGGFDYAYWELELNATEEKNGKMGLYELYEKQYPSERLDATTTYYVLSDRYGDDDQFPDTGGLPLSYFS
jgi:hypothetical protein